MLKIHLHKLQEILGNIRYCKYKFKAINKIRINNIYIYLKN
jgi:hypothetical protein